MTPVNNSAKASLILPIMVICTMTAFIYSCGSGGSGDGSVGTGSVNFSLLLRNPTTSRALIHRQLDDDTSTFACEGDTYRIAAIEAEVVDSNEVLLAEGGPFDCKDRQGDIGGVEAGDGRIVKVFAIDESGEPIAEGESEPLTVIAGRTVNAGNIELIFENTAPVADAGPDQTPFVDETVTLDGSGSSDADGDLLSFSWSITSSPSGSQAVISDPTAVNPTFVVDVFGEYIAELIVNDGAVDSEPDEVIINTDNSAPVADAGPDQTPLVNETVTLDGSGSSDVDGDLLSFSWLITSSPSGSQTVISDPTVVNPTFVVDEFGEYIAELIVNDGTVDSEPDEVIINTDNSAPVADAGPDQTPLVNETVTLDGSGSSDVDGNVLSLSWSFISLPPDSQAILSDLTAVNPTFDVDIFGTYVVQLIVNDGTVDSEPDEVIINTDNSAPVADAGPDQTPFVDETVTLDGSGSSDVDGDLLSFLWSISSPSGSQTALSDPTAVNPTFVVDIRGTYVVQLIVNDGTADSTPDTVTVNVQNSAPVISPVDPQNVIAGNTVQFTLTASDPDGDPLSFPQPSGLPDGVVFTFTDNGNNTATFSWDTVFGDLNDSPYIATFQVFDNQSPALSDSEDVTITLIDEEDVAIPVDLSIVE